MSELFSILFSFITHFPVVLRRRRRVRHLEQQNQDLCGVHERAGKATTKMYVRPKFVKKQVCLSEKVQTDIYVIVSIIKYQKIIYKLR